MAEDAHVGVLESSQHAGRHLLTALLKTRVNAGDYDIHLRQHFVVHVERAVCQDVHLDAGEDADAALHVTVDFVNVLDLFEGAFFVEAAGHGQDLGVVGDGDVVVADGEGGLGHFED